MNDLVADTKSIVRGRMAGQQAGHSIDHVMRVLRTAQELQAEVGGDLETIQLAAILHDIGDAKFHDGVERSGEFAREILCDLGAEPGLVDQVAHIVDNISFRKGIDAKELTLEGKVVQDADRLDALGAIGIVRTIEYGAAVGQPFHDPDGDVAQTGIGHFHEKLFKLRALLNTNAARRIAADREKFMRQFLRQYKAESGKELHLESP